MLTTDSSECERDIQLELNKNYLKSFPARPKFCHILLGSVSAWLLNYYTAVYYDYEWLTFFSIRVSSMLALCSLVLLVTSTINWDRTGKIMMARINYIFHTVAIILLGVSTGILVIGVSARILIDRFIINYHLPFVVSVFGVSAINIINSLLYYSSIKLVRTTCENY